MNRVRSAGPGVERTMQRLREGNAAPTRHVRARANELSEIAKDLHRTAPRGGENLNRFGERRSAPREVPAMETGGLFAMIDQGVKVEPMTATVTVSFGFGPNRGSLEAGTRRMAPRPLGRRALTELKQRIK